MDMIGQGLVEFFAVHFGPFRSINVHLGPRKRRQVAALQKRRGYSLYDP